SWFARRCEASSGDAALRLLTMGSSRVLLVALQKFDRDALRAAQEADAHAGADGGRLLRELDALALDRRRDRVDVLHGEAEMVEHLLGRHRRGVDAVACRDWRGEDR